MTTTVLPQYYHSTTTVLPQYYDSNSSTTVVHIITTPRNSMTPRESQEAPRILQISPGVPGSPRDSPGLPGSSASHRDFPEGISGSCVGTRVAQQAVAELVKKTPLKSLDASPAIPGSPRESTGASGSPRESPGFPGSPRESPERISGSCVRHARGTTSRRRTR